VKILVGLVATVILFLVGLFIVYPQVSIWRKNRILHLAEQYLRKEDYRSSYLLLEQFVRKTPTNFTARRMLANVCEKLGSEQALTEWESLMIAEPTNPANYAGYATAALKFGQIGQLPGVLKTLQALAPESGEFHRLAAGSALAHGDLVALVSTSHFWRASSRRTRLPDLAWLCCS
jgi:hypothetical protein